MNKSVLTSSVCTLVLGGSFRQSTSISRPLLNELNKVLVRSMREGFRLDYKNLTEDVCSARKALLNEQ